jgi:hypothetical protein
MSQLDSLAEDKDLMKGLEELEIKEKEDIFTKKQLPIASPRTPLAPVIKTNTPAAKSKFKEQG